MTIQANITDEPLASFIARVPVGLVTVQEGLHDSGTAYWQASGCGPDLPRTNPDAYNGVILARGETRAEALANLETAIVAARRELAA